MLQNGMHMDLSSLVRTLARMDTLCSAWARAAHEFVPNSVVEAHGNIISSLGSYILLCP